MNSNLLLFSLALAFSVVFATYDHRGAFDFYDIYDDYDGHGEMDEDEVIARYPGLFKTEEEMDKIHTHALGQNKREVTRRVWESLSSSIWTFQSVKESLSLSVSLVNVSGTLYHGCCATNQTFANFSSMADQDKKTVQIVQYTNRYQWFEVDSCVETPSCSDNCTCQKVSRFYSALIYNPDYPANSNKKYKLDLVQANTICRCINNTPSGPSKRKRDEF